MARRSTFNRTTKFMLVLFGISPGIPFLTLCRGFWIVTIAFLEFCHCRYLLTHISSAELMNLMDCMCTFLAHGKVILKCAIFWINQHSHDAEIHTVLPFGSITDDGNYIHRQFNKLLGMMTDDWNECRNSEISMREMTRKAKTSDNIINTIIGLHTMSVISYCIGVIIADVDINDYTELPLVDKLELPFNIGTQNIYRLILITEFLHMIMCGWSAGITNGLLLTFILHAAGQMDIVRCWLVQPVDRTKQGSVVITTRQIIKKHQKIIDFSKNIESLYTYIALIQFASNTIMICAFGFLIIMSVGTPNAMKQIVKSILFYTITNLEAFIFCFAGEYLSNKSKAIGAAAYNSLWYDLKSRDSRVLLFMILRSQKQLTLTAGKIMELSLQSFTSIMNASGSYLSVLIAMQ